MKEKLFHLNYLFIIFYLSVPEKFIVRYDTMKTYFEEQGVEVIDYSNEVFPDNCYSTYDHMNARGAKLFTMMLSQRLHLNP